MKLAARILLIFVFASAAAQVASYFQARHQLVSPLIPEDTVRLIARPHLYAAVVLLAAGILALGVLAARRFLPAVLIAAAALLVNLLGHQYGWFFAMGGN